MKPLITRINVISLYIVINLLMAQVTTALPFHLWDLSYEGGTLKVSLAKRQPKVTDSNDEGDTSTLDKITNRNKNIWEQLAQDEDEGSNRLTENQAMLTANDMLRQAAIAAAAQNVTRKVQAAGVSLKNGIRLPALKQGVDKLNKDDGLIWPKPFENPKILDRTANEYIDDDVDERPIENIESFLAGVEEKYGTRNIVNEIVKRVLKETPTTAEEKEAAAESERFKKLKMESNRRHKGKNQHLHKPKDEEEGEMLTCTMKCQSKASNEKPKEVVDLPKEKSHDKQPTESEDEKDEKDKTCDEKEEEDNETDLEKELNKERRKKPKLKATKVEDDKWSSDQVQNNPFKLNCQTTHYDTLRNELNEYSTKMIKEKQRTHKEDSDEKSKEHLVKASNKKKKLKVPSDSKITYIKITTEEPYPIEEPIIEDNTKETITEEKSKTAEDQVETDSKDRKKQGHRKSKIEEYIDNGEEQIDPSGGSDYNEQLENPLKIDNFLRGNIPNSEANTYSSFSKVMNYENEDWYKKLMNDGETTKKQIDLPLTAEKFKKSLSLNIAEPLPKLPKKYHTIKISGKLTEEDEVKDDKDVKENKQKEEEEKQLKEWQEKEQLKEKLKVKFKEQTKEQQKDQQKYQSKEQLKDQIKDQPKVQQKLQQKEQLKDKQKEPLKDLTKEQLKDQPKDQPKDSTKEQLKDQLKDQPKDSIKEHLKDQPKEQPKDSTKEQLKDQPKEQKDQLNEQEKLKVDKEKEPTEQKEKDDKDKLLSEAAMKPKKTGEDEEDADYFTNWPVKTARLMLLKTINAEILELEAIRNRTMQEFKNNGTETTSTTTEAPTTTTEATTEETTTEASSTTESTPVSNTTTECIVTTTEEPTTATDTTTETSVTTTTEINCDTTAKYEYSTLSPLTVDCLTTKRVNSAAHDRRHGKTNKGIPVEVTDGTLLLPLTKFNSDPSESRETFKRILPRHTVNTEETKEDTNEYDYDDTEDESDENSKLQTRRENQDDDYDAVISDKSDDNDDLDLNNSDNAESPAITAVKVRKNEKSAMGCDDDEDDKAGDSDIGEGVGKSTTQVRENHSQVTCDGNEGSANGSANDLSPTAQAPKADVKSKSSLENIIKVSEDNNLPNTKILALQDLRGVKCGVDSGTPPRLNGVIPPREFSVERELFRIMAGLSGGHEKPSKPSSDTANGQEECKKTVKQPEKKFTIF